MDSSNAAGGLFLLRRPGHDGLKAKRSGPGRGLDLGYIDTADLVVLLLLYLPSQKTRVSNAGIPAYSVDM